MHSREAAVAGMFYPSDADELRSQIIDLLNSVPDEYSVRPKAIIAPHAGYQYSGIVAASAYAPLKYYANDIHRVILLGPSHRVPLRGVAYCSADYYNTPLGRCAIDKEAQDILIQNTTNSITNLHLSDQAHKEEHSLEVHVPFLQVLLHDFKIIPLVVGDTEPQNLLPLFETFWHDSSTLFVISSDLSHFHDYATAQEMDQHSAEIITAMSPYSLTYDDACGRNPVNGLLYAARQHDLTAKQISLKNSGDTAGDKSRVVGYGAFHFLSP